MDAVEEEMGLVRIGGIPTHLLVQRRIHKEVPRGTCFDDEDPIFFLPDLSWLPRLRDLY